jgi:hypothetical protein
VPSLLVVLLAISLIVVAAGLLLSYKPSVRDQRVVPTTRMGQGVIVVDSMPPRTRSVVQSKQLVARRSPMKIDPYARAMIATPIIIDHGFGRIQSGKPIPWMRMIIGLVAIFLIGLFSLHFLSPRDTNWNLLMWYGSSPSTAQSSTQSSQFNPQFNAPKSLVRLSQLDPSQYASN